MCAAPHLESSSLIAYRRTVCTPTDTHASKSTHAQSDDPRVVHFFQFIKPHSSLEGWQKVHAQIINSYIHNTHTYLAWIHRSARAKKVILTPSDPPSEALTGVLVVVLLLLPANLTIKDLLAPSRVVYNQESCMWW